MTLNEESMKKIIKSRTRQHTVDSFKYFWASLALQITVYALLSHVLVKHWGSFIMVLSMIGIALYIPFTVVFMKKFKRMATLKDTAISPYVQRQYELLESFYTFKRRYEMVLIPIATLIGTYITFEIYVPGQHTKGLVMVFLAALASCIIAIREENKKSFDIPLSKLKMIIDDLRTDI